MYFLIVRTCITVAKGDRMMYSRDHFVHKINLYRSYLYTGLYDNVHINLHYTI